MQVDIFLDRASLSTCDKDAEFGLWGSAKDLRMHQDGHVQVNSRESTALR